MVLDQAVRAPRPLGQSVHRGLDDPGDSVVVGVGRLTALEEHVRVLSCTPHVGGVGVHPPAPELDKGIGVDHRRQVLARQRGDLRQLVRGPETVEEVQERHPRPQGCGVGDQGEVVRLLDRTGCQHGPARRPGMHDIGVVAEYGQGVGGDGAGRDMDDRRCQFTGDLEHVGHHQQQAL